MHVLSLLLGCILASPGYAVVVSRATHADEGWRAAVEALSEKHAARGVEVVIWEGEVGEAREALARIRPRHTCFVARSEEATADFVAACHRLTRALDADPYGDTIWAILTGYEAADAVRIARHAEPLGIDYALAGSSSDWLAWVREGEGYSEGTKNRGYTKAAGSPEVVTHDDAPDDTTTRFVEALNGGRVRAMWTSGHANEHNWEIGYSYPNGRIVSRAGRLFGLDLGGQLHEIRSPNPKVYLGPGNCLIGRIDGPDCMALAWMHAGGALQFYGYTVPTWYGFMGWGIHDAWVRMGGRRTLAEGFYVSNQQLLFGLVEEGVLTSDRDRSGHAFDRDGVVLYGDPAGEARLVAGEAGPRPAYRVALDEHCGNGVGYRVTAGFDFEEGARFDVRRPLVEFLPRRLDRAEVVGIRGPGAEDVRKAVVTDDLLLVLTVADPRAFLVDIAGRPVEEGEGPAPVSSPVATLDEGRVLHFLLPQVERRFQIDGGGEDGDEGPAVRRLRDRDHASVELLARHARLALEARQIWPWCAAYGETDFLRYVAGYRLTAERLTDWRTRFRGDAELLALAEGARAAWTEAADHEGRSAAFRALLREVNTLLASRASYAPRGMPDLAPEELFEQGTGRCTDLTNAYVAMLRSVGVAATGVRTIWWPKGDSNHFWAGILDPATRAWLDVDAGVGGAAGEGYYRVGRGREHAKVYRVTPDPEATPVEHAVRPRPGESHPFAVVNYLESLPMEDVTADYTTARALVVEGLPAERPVYLAVWNNGRWSEAACVRSDGEGRASFGSVGASEILYAVTVRDEGGASRVAHGPFTLSPDGLRAYTAPDGPPLPLAVPEGLEVFRDGAWRPAGRLRQGALHRAGGRPFVIRDEGVCWRRVGY